MNTSVTTMTAPTRWHWKKQGKTWSYTCRHHGTASKLMWIYWHHEPESQWFGNWVALHVTTHENAGMTRVMVHEVMYDMTAVKVRKSAGRMRTSGGTAKFECVHLGNIAAIARTNTGVFVSPKPLVFHGCGRGGVWDLTSHITCLASQCGQTGNHAQEEFDLCFNNVERPVQVYLPPKIHHDALGFILEQLTPVAHERVEMSDDKQDDLHHRLLRCGIRAQGPLCGSAQ